MTKRLEFFFDVGSPASYLAWTQLPTICERTGAELVCRPMLLGGVFQATGNVAPGAVAAKGRHGGVDFGRFAKRYGVPLTINPFFPINTLMLMRAVTGVQLKLPARFQDFLGGVFDAMWVHPRNLNEAAVTAQALTDAGFDPSQIVALANEPEVKAQLRSNTEEAVARGAFGAPTMFIGEEMFFGQDRLDFVREALA